MRSLRLPLVFFIVGIIATLYLAFRLVLPNATTSQNTSSGTYIEGVAGAPRAINPLLCDLNEADRDICSLTFVGLTRFNEYGEVVPQIGTWVISSDGQNYTFKLQAGYRWHDGVSVTADDVMFTVGMLQAPEFPGRPDIAALWKTVKAEKTDQDTVVFKLAEPYAPFLDYSTIGLLPRHILSGTLPSQLDKIPFNLQPVGNGPWRVTQVGTSGVRVSSVTLEPVANAVPGVSKKPNLSRLVFRYYANPEAVVEAFRNGDVDGINSINPEIAKQLGERTDLTVYSTKQTHVVSLFINQRRDSGVIALSEKSVRQALMLALDRRRIISDALDNRAVLAHSLFIPGTWAYNNDVKQYEFDLAKAKQMLRDAGYDFRAVAPSPVEVWQKDGEALAFTMLTPDDPPRRAVAEGVAAQWRDLGVRVTVQPVRNLQRDFLESRSYQVALVEISMDGDPDPYPLWHPSQSVRGQNYTGYNNKQAGEMIEAARVTNDRTQRITQYYKFQEAFAEDLPAIPLYYPIYRYGVASHINNVQLPALTYASDRLRSLADWTVGNRVVRRQ